MAADETGLVKSPVVWKLVELPLSELVLKEKLLSRMSTFSWLNFVP